MGPRGLRGRSSLAILFRSSSQPYRARAGRGACRGPAGAATSKAGPSDAVRRTDSRTHAPDGVLTEIRLFLRHGNGDVAEHQPSGMVALDIERSRLAFIRIQCAASDAFDFFCIDYFDAIANDGDSTTNERDVERLPFTWRTRQLRT